MKKTVVRARGLGKRIPSPLSNDRLLYTTGMRPMQSSGVVLQTEGRIVKRSRDEYLVSIGEPQRLTFRHTHGSESADVVVCLLEGWQVFECKKPDASVEDFCSPMILDGAVLYRPFDDAIRKDVRRISQINANIADLSSLESVVQGYDYVIPAQRAGISTIGTMETTEFLPGGISTSELAIGEIVRTSNQSSGQFAVDYSRKTTLTEVEEKVQGLNELIANDNDRASEFIANELQKVPLEAKWRNALVLASEDVEITQPQVRQKIRDYLQRLALHLRNSLEPEIELIVYSAIRRYASLIEVREADALIPFLNQDAAIDTRLVALMSLSAIFEVAQPITTAPSPELATRIHEFAIKLVDPDVLTAGEISAIAEQAICVLAAMGDRRLPSVWEAVRKLKHHWFSEQVLLALSDVADEIQSRGIAETSCTALAHINQILQTAISLHEPGASGRPAGPATRPVA